jgi:hypothetical protein
MGSMMQFELMLPDVLITYFGKLKQQQCFEVQAAVNGTGTRYSIISINHVIVIILFYLPCIKIF